MIAAVSSNSAPLSFVPPRIERRQHRQRFLEWDRDEAAEARRLATTRSAPPTERAPTERNPAAGPRRMGDVMPDVLARYGLTL